MVEWLAPWNPVSDDPSQAKAMEAELRRELVAGHSLHRVPVRAMGRRRDRDDVLFGLEDGSRRVAVVHLTWKPPERPPWPITRFYSDFEAWVVEAISAGGGPLVLFIESAGPIA